MCDVLQFEKLEGMRQARQILNDACEQHFFEGKTHSMISSEVKAFVVFSVLRARVRYWLFRWKSVGGKQNIVPLSWSLVEVADCCHGGKRGLDWLVGACAAVVCVCCVVCVSG